MSTMLCSPGPSSAGIITEDLGRVILGVSGRKVTDNRRSALLRGKPGGPGGELFVGRYQVLIAARLASSLPGESKRARRERRQRAQRCSQARRMHDLPLAPPPGAVRWSGPRNEARIG